MKKTLLFLCLLLVILSSIAFGNTNTQTIEVELFTNDKINLKSYIRGQDTNFDFNNQTVIQNLNAKVVTVDRNYWMKPASAGKSTLMLSSGTNQLVVEVTVSSPIESITLDDRNLTLLMGELYQLNYTIEAIDGYDKPLNVEFNWSSDNDRIAEITSDSIIKTKAVGTTRFTGVTLDGSYAVAFNLTVLGHSKKLNVFSTNHVYKLNAGDQLGLSATLGTKDVTQNIIWESLTPDILVVDNKGLVTAIGEGTGQIVGKTTDKSKSDVYKITTQSMIDKVELNTSRIKFNTVGETQQLWFNLYPKDKSNPPILKGYHYSTSNSSIASVTDTGLITAKAPGIALISIIFEDSQKKATCTVEVPDNFEPPIANYIPLKSIKLDAITETLYIGQKYKLNYDIFPDNASNTNISFKVHSGGNNQIQELDGYYYFIPNTRGNIKIEVQGANNQMDSITVAVTSAVDSIDLSLSTRRRTSSIEELLYVGETAEVITKINRRSGHAIENAYPNTFTYTIDDEKVAKLFVKNDTYFVQGLKKGKTKIHVKSIDQAIEETLWVKVDNPIQSITTDSKVELPQNIYYRPRIFSNLSIQERYLNSSFNINALTNIRVENFYISTSFIDEEIIYESSMLTNDTDKNHAMRLNQLKELKDQASDGYILLNEPTIIKDRYGKSYKFYAIKDNKIIGYYPSKIDLTISLEDKHISTNTVLIWSDNKTSLSLTRYNNTYTLNQLIDQFDLSIYLNAYDQESKIKLFITYLNNLEKFETLPTAETLSALSKFSADDDLLALIPNLDDKVTKGDLAHLSLYLKERYIGKSSIPDNTKDSYYYDAFDPAIKKALNLGYLAPRSNFYFGSSDLSAEKDFVILVSKITPSRAEKLYGSSKILTFEKIIHYLDQMTQ